MISQVQFGNLFNSGGRTVLGGSSTGYDTESLISGLTDAKRLPAVQLEERLEENALRQTAFGSMQTILNRFRDTASLLRNPPGVNNAADNLFEYRTGSVQSNTGIDASNYLDVTVEPGTDLANYDVTIDAIATFSTKTTETFALADADTDAVGSGLPFNAGTLTLGPFNVDIEIEETDTLTQVVDKINAVSDNSFVRASILQVSDGNFRLQLRTTETGTDYNYDFENSIHAQVGNEIVIEAERFSTSIARSGDSFDVYSDVAASGGEYIEAGPNDGGTIGGSIETAAPEVTYQVDFDSAGTYYIHVLGRGNSTDDSMHIGLDGVVQADSTSIKTYDENNFVWSNTNQFNATAQMVVGSEGVHTLNAYMREDGLDIDKIILTTDAGYSPSGNAQTSTLTGSSSIFNVGFAIQKDATDAELTIDGTTVTRSSNSIDDLIDGVTFNLNQATPADTELRVDVEPDLDVVRGGIISFIDSYNEMRVFAAQQTELDDDGLPTEEAVLVRNSTLRGLSSSILTELNSIVSGLNTEPNRLSDLGITLDDFAGDDETPFTRNILVLDQDTLDSALQANYQAVRDVFEFDFNSDNTELQVFSRTNSIEINEFELDIDIANEVFTANYTDRAGDLQSVALDFSVINGGGYLLKGVEGTVLDGLSLIYSGTTDSTANVSLTQGIGDRLFNTLESALDTENGVIAIELDSLSDQNERFQLDIDRIDRVVDRFRQQQIERFSALEAAISSINTLLQSLEANAEANSA